MADRDIPSLPSVTDDQVDDTMIMEAFRAGRNVKLTRAQAQSFAGGGAKYLTGAVSLDGATYATNAAAAMADSQFLSADIWFYIPAGRSEALDFLDFDPANTECPEIGIQNGDTTPSIVFIASNAQSISFSWSIPRAQLFPGWHNLLMSIDTSPSGSGGVAKQGILFLDDQFVPLAGQSDNAQVPFTMLMSGLILAIPDTPADDTPLTGYLSDYWVDNTKVDFAVLATRRKFIDANGRPVDLGADGSTPTGTAPAIFLRRAPDAAASTWADNLGTCGPFTVTGAFTNAPSSPTD